MSDLLTKLVANDLCNGCGLCAKELMISKSGNLIPIEFRGDVDDVEKFCPGVSQVNHNKILKSVEKFGSILEAYEAYSTNDDIRERGSSGGVITAVLTSLLKQKLVDGVYGLCNTYGLHYEGRIISSVDEIILNAGSKYCPSPTLSRIKDIEEFEGKLAIVAKPCEINTIKSMLKSKGNKSKHIYISFFCAGLPTYNGTLTLINELGGQVSTIDDVSNVNYRGGGWPGNFIAKTRNGTYMASYEESWGKHLNKTLPLICKICPDGIGLSADIVCADYWETDQKGYPVFDNKPGKSLLILRTDLGLNAISKVIDNNDIYVSAIHENLNASLERIQPLQSMRRSTFEYRRMALKLKGMPTPKLIGFYCKASITFKEKLRAFVGMYVRANKHVKD